MLETIAAVIKEFKADPQLAVTETTTFAALELDSLEIVELVMKLEEQLGVSIEVGPEIKSVGDLIKTIENAQ
ncbi:MAG TPA: phosphopantetheine-binding protein [Candidatus Acidoferrum sp.]|nr:phosphopantetheine-binding protein [Candidatus Acidoferrum sp.]